jgi:hypothetical protein
MSLCHPPAALHIKLCKMRLGLWSSLIAHLGYFCHMGKAYIHII